MWLAPSGLTFQLAHFSTNSSRRRGVEHQFLKSMNYWRPGNLAHRNVSAKNNESIWRRSVEGEERTCTSISAESPEFGHYIREQWRGSSAAADRQQRWLMLTQVNEQFGFPHTPRMPICSRLAPAHDNILLIRMT
jgi:hypothetical protein